MPDEREKEASRSFIEGSCFFGERQPVFWLKSSGTVGSGTSRKVFFKLFPPASISAICLCIIESSRS